MAQVKDARRDDVALTQNIRDVEEAPDHVPSAGEVLIKDLVVKQTRTDTSLREQLAVKQDFVRGVGLDPTLGGGLVRIEDVLSAVQIPLLQGPSNVSQEPLSIDDLMQKTGLSRSQLETHLSVKPDSEITKLYKFALSNQQASTSKSLISQLPDHPLNQLKGIEEEFMKKVLGEKELSEKKRRKRRTRSKRKKLAECGPHPKEEYRTICESTSTGKEGEECRQLGDRLEAEEGESSSGSAERRGPPRPSLWDVKDMKRFCSTTEYGCQPKKLFTVRDGQIVEVTKDIMEND